MPTDTKYFIYARKSTDDTSRQIRSIDDQIAELRELADREGLTVVDVLIEKRTAKSPGRPVFNQMLERIEAGDVAGILAWHPDRLARNSLDGGRLIYLVDTGQIQDLRFPTFAFEPTASGKLMLGMMFGQSKYYVDNLSENITRGIRQKVRNGIWPAAAPVGYLNDRMTRTIVIDPKRGPLVKKAFELYATGDYTLAQVRAKINGLGLIGVRGGTLSKGNFHRFLNNPIYCGLIRHKGEVHEGRHEPLISKRLFDQAQTVMNRKSRPKTRASQPYLYKGMFHCGECGCMITNERQKGHVYLRCTKKRGQCSQPYVREEDMTEQVSAALQAVSLPPEDADWMLGELQNRQAKAQTAASAAKKGVRTELSEIDGKLERLQDAYLEELVSLEEFRTTKNRLTVQKAELRARLDRIEAGGRNRLEPVARFIKASRATGFVAQGDDDEKIRDMLKTVGSNRHLRDGELFLTPVGAWQLLATSGLLTQTPQSRVSATGVDSSELADVPNKAERVGFEPTVTQAPHRFSRPALSTAQAPLQGICHRLWQAWRCQLYSGGSAGRSVGVMAMPSISTSQPGRQTGARTVRMGVWPSLWRRAASMIGASPRSRR
jgi:site-specific DNA recombinase